MYAFDEQYGIFLEVQAFAVVFALAGNKVVLRHFNDLAGQQVQHVAVEHVMVDGVEIVEVIAPVRKLGGIETVDEIVVRRE